MPDDYNTSSQPPTLNPTPPYPAPAAGWAPPGGHGPQPPAGTWQYGPQPQRQATRRSSGWRVVFWLFLLAILGGSILLNLVLLGTVGSLEAQGGLARQVIEGGKSNQTVAVYRVIGIIDGSAVSQFTQFRNAVAYDRDVKAVVLRVDSPGGGVTASDQICNMVKQLKGHGKTVVVSMGSVAASGGYYISAPADEIIAEDTTITGSIGVITGWFVFKGTLEKIGAESFTIKSSNAQVWKDEMSPTASPQEYQIEHIRSILDDMQARFEKVVKEGRVDQYGNSKINPQTETVRLTDEDGKTTTKDSIEPFNGKVYLADKAKELGLIDSIGYEADAIDRAKKLASLTNARVVRFARRKTFMEQMFDGKAENPLTIDRNLLDQLQTPKFMMLWKVE